MLLRSPAKRSIKRNEIGNPGKAKENQPLLRCKEGALRNENA
jgi:hypothetical protein